MPFCFMLKKDHFQEKLLLRPQGPFKMMFKHVFIILSLRNSSKVDVNALLLKLQQ